VGDLFRLQRPVTMRDGLACGRQVLPYGQTVSFASDDDVLDTGQVGSVGDLCISDEVMPAYSEDHMLAAQVQGLKLP